MSFSICCNKNNDLYVTLQKCGCNVSHYETPQLAIANAPENSGVLILADSYPLQAIQVSMQELIEAKQKKVRLYIEFFSDTSDEEIKNNYHERAVVSTDEFGTDLSCLSILAMNDFYFTQRECESPLMVAAIVAGNDTAVFGLPEKTWPLLYKQDENILAATTKLSHFLTGRYAPGKAWKVIWQYILEWLNGGKLDFEFDFVPFVTPLYGRNDKLPDTCEKRVFDRAVDWHYKSYVLAHPDDDEKFMKQFVDDNPYMEHGKDDCFYHPIPDRPEGGDGTYGILEGYGTYIDYNGNQRLRCCRRSDNLSETAMAIAAAWQINGREKDRQLAENLLDSLYFKSNLQQGPMADPKHPAFGLTAWHMEPTTGTTLENRNYLGPDCQQIPTSILASVFLDDERWSKKILTYMCAVERITGRNGWGYRMTTKDLETYGWKHYHDQELTAQQIWVDDKGGNFILAYMVTGYEPFLQIGKNCIYNIMKLYPDKLRWANSLTAQRCGLIRSLAWLVRYEDTELHCDWLFKVIRDQLEFQDDSGAIRGDLGAPGRGEVTGHPPLKSNEEYGTREGPLIQNNTDPITDVMYSDAFCMIGLHEAYMATGEQFIKEAADKLADFVCRVQISSEKFPYLDGAWFRAFDFGKWEYWGNDSDQGWGAFAIETGWTQAWNMMSLALRHMNTSIWDLCKKSKIKQYLPEVLELMQQNDGSPYLE